MNQSWYPHVTVATIVERAGRYLMVREMSAGRSVINQPAGHLEPHETLFEAARRETLEETGWQVRIDALVGFYLYTAPANQTTYWRTLFCATALEQATDCALDNEIIEALWLSKAELQAQQNSLRSPLVLRGIEDYEAGIRLPLQTITHLSPS